MAYHYIVGKIVWDCWQLHAHQEDLPEDVNRVVRNVVLPDHAHPNVRELKVPLENYLKTADRKAPLSKQCEKILDLIYLYDSHTISRKTSFVNYLARKLFRKKD